MNKTKEENNEEKLVNNYQRYTELNEKTWTKFKEFSNKSIPGQINIKAYKEMQALKK
ncbi:MAG: hypothetical protein LBT66_09045 [Methanobrevibacter sp.]|jgi:hypothetical protein|nr:hypothetical protein [Candidatus Methanovirga meridionalis]